MLLSDHSEITVAHTVNNGRAVLEVLKKHSIDVILLDINHPLMNGLEVCKVVKRTYQYFFTADSIYIGMRKNVAQTQLSIGQVFLNTGDYQKTNDYYLERLGIAKEEKNFGYSNYLVAEN